MTIRFWNQTSNRQDRTSNFCKARSNLSFWPAFEFWNFFLAEKLQEKILNILVNLIFTKSVCAEKKENLKTFFSFSCNLYCRKNVTLFVPNVRNVRRTLGPNFEHFWTSQFSPKPNFEPPEHPKKPNSSRTPDCSFQDYDKLSIAFK